MWSKWRSSRLTDLTPGLQLPLDTTWSLLCTALSGRGDLFPQHHWVWPCNNSYITNNTHPDVRIFQMLARVDK